MEGQSNTLPALRFGSFELDVRSRELRKGDTRIRLQEQPFEILRVMLERPGDVVTRDELRQRLWPEGTFVDFEHSLNAAVKRLRAVLGDSADNPTFVETLPRRGYRFIAPLAPAAAQDETESPRLAVLPFTNLSDDAEQDYFADGLTEELISQLGRLCRGRINVIARRSSMAFKGTFQRARDIAHTLNVRYLLEGSVRRDGPRVRITVRLIEGSVETELWSDTHDRTVDDWLSVQADVAAHVARSLMLELAPDHTSAPSPPPTRAYELYLKARYLWLQPGDVGLEDAITLTNEALVIAPEYPAAHAFLSRLMIGAAEYYRRVPAVALRQARESAQRALALEPTNAEARISLADLSRLVDFDWRAAKFGYRDVLASNPSTEVAHRGYAFLLTLQGRHADAMRAADLSREIDPLCLLTSVTAAWTRYMAGDYETAIAVCRQTLEMEPTYVGATRVLALAFLQVEECELAISHLERAVAAVGRDPHLVATLAHACGCARRGAEAQALIAELSAAEPSRYVSPYHVALAHVGIGDSDGAFAALTRAYEDRDPHLAYVMIEPRFAPLRNDPRFASLAALLRLSVR
jgi:TolB-like protein/Flp pilus assembly protein TadD